MADLEKNLEQAIAEAMQPNSKAEKGDSKPVKQGSSDAAKIDGGKAEVVKPEENPVDKAVASVKSAEKGTKEVSGDPQQKGESPAEKQPKLKNVKEEEVSESEKPSKMQTIKAMVNAMKDMSKSDLSAMYSEMKKVDDEDEDEDSKKVDESLTKAEIARNIVEFLKSSDEETVEETYNSIIEAKTKEEKEDEKDDEDEDDEEEVKESSEIDSDLVEMEIEDDLSKISEALDLSEENSEKARTIFKKAACCHFLQKLQK
jgi:nucleoid-associated protein YgaU